MRMNGAYHIGTLGSGTAVTISLIGAPVPSTLWAIPAAGDTVNMWVSFDNGTNWTEWSKGAVTAAANAALISGATHLKAQRTAGTGTTSTFGVC